MSESTIDASTIQAYLKTEYRVHGEKPMTLQIGQYCAALAAIHKQHRVDCSAYISACNPYGQPLSDATNATRHADLGQELRQRSLITLEGVGQHPSNQWPGEASYLVLGLTLQTAKALGTSLEQNAIVWSGADAIPQLILLR